MKKQNLREQLIKNYEEMMYRYGEFDVWDDDIQPKLATMSDEDIARAYKADKKFYESREKAGGCW